MKYWNKRKHVRQRCWTCIKLKVDNTISYSVYRGWTSWKQYDSIKLELQRIPNKGKFYMQISKKEIWFEKARDATWFTLKYQGIKNEI